MEHAPAPLLPLCCGTRRERDTALSICDVRWPARHGSASARRRGAWTPRPWAPVAWRRVCAAHPRTRRPATEWSETSWGRCTCLAGRSGAPPRRGPLTTSQSRARRCSCRTLSCARWRKSRRAALETSDGARVADSRSVARAVVRAGSRGARQLRARAAAVPSCSGGRGCGGQGGVRRTAPSFCCRRLLNGVGHQREYERRACRVEPASAATELKRAWVRWRWRAAPFA